MSAPWPADASDLERTLAFFEGLGPRALALVDAYYAIDARFEDPMVSLRGRDRLRTYYASVYRNDPELRWDFGPPVVDAGRLALPWTMHLRVDGLARGRWYEVPGLSLLAFDDARFCVDHRDYFDMGGFVYERLPVLGTVVRAVKRKLHASGLDDPRSGPRP